MVLCGYSQTALRIDLWASDGHVILAESFWRSHVDFGVVILILSFWQLNQFDPCHIGVDSDDIPRLLLFKSTKTIYLFCYSVNVLGLTRWLTYGII